MPKKAHMEQYLRPSASSGMPHEQEARPRKLSWSNITFDSLFQTQNLEAREQCQRKLTQSGIIHDPIYLRRNACRPRSNA
eukprot:1144113-Pelagomonas_calceolata.AAC.3